MYLLAIVGVMTSVIGAVYYIRLIKIMYFEKLRAFNFYQEVDKEKSVDDPYTGNSFISFHEEKLAGHTIFRTAFDSYHGIFCSEQFKLAVEKASLRGIVFSKDLGNMFPEDDSATQPHLN